MIKITVTTLATFLLSACETTYVMDGSVSPVNRDLAECRQLARQQALQSPGNAGLAFAPASPYGLNPAVVQFAAAIEGATRDCMIAKGYRQQ